MEAILRPVGLLAEMERDPGDEGGAESVAELAQWGELAGVDSLGCLDLEGDDTAVVPFEDEIDLVAVPSAPMPDTGDAVEPGEDEPTWPPVPIELRLDGVEHQRHVLVLVDAHGLGSGDERRGIGRDDVTDGDVHLRNWRALFCGSGATYGVELER